MVVNIPQFRLWAMRLEGGDFRPDVTMRVACDEPEHCTGPLHQCVNGRCVECVMNDDCPTLEASECYIGTHACRPCTGDDACLGRAGTPHCIAGTCAP